MARETWSSAIRGGILTYRLERAQTQVEQPDGIGLSLNWRPTNFGTDRALLILRLRMSYSVLVDQRQFFNAWETSEPVHDLGSPHPRRPTHLCELS